MFINDEAQKQVLPIIARTSVAPATEAQQRAGSLLQLNPGQQVKAEIIANLPNNLFLARIAGQLYKLEIPLNVQPGETMEMTFLTAEPRITFQVFRQQGSGASVQLSTIGKWLATVVRDAPPLSLVREPLLESPAQGTPFLAQALKEAVARSGLFYESHLAQWAAGTLQLKELLKEPQGRLSRAASEEGGGDDAAGTAEAEIADARALPLIKEQLLLMNSGVFSWRGEAWAGQGMELAISESKGDDAEAGVEATLLLQLPALGGVEARVRLTPEGVQVGFVCDRAGGAGVLREGAEELRAALAAAGLHLDRMAARDGEESE